MRFKDAKGVNAAACALCLQLLLSFLSQSQKPWIESTFNKRECVYILPVSKDPHRYVLRLPAVRPALIVMETGVIAWCACKSRPDR